MRWSAGQGFTKGLKVNRMDTVHHVDCVTFGIYEDILQKLAQLSHGVGGMPED